MNGAAGLIAAKVALGPVLLPQAKWLQRTVPRLPEPVEEHPDSCDFVERRDTPPVRPEPVEGIQPT